MAKWKEITDYPNYEVSDEGQVRNVKTGKILKLTLSGSGYLRAVICSNGKIKWISIHTLVLNAFVGPKPPKKQCCCHYDGDRRNNNIINLRWGTYQDNADDKKRHNTQPKGSVVHNAKLTEAIVRKCRLFYAQGQTQKSLAQMFGVGTTAMHYAITGKQWKHVK